MVQVGGEAVRVCRFSPDSTLLATAGDNGQVCIWDLVHRNLIRQDLLQRIYNVLFYKKFNEKYVIIQILILNFFCKVILVLF